MPPLPGGRAITLSRFESCVVADAEQCDLSDLTFIDAFCVVATASSILAASRSGKTPSVTLPAAPQVVEHLAAMGFLRFLRDIGQALEVDAAPSDRGDVVVPLTRIATVFEAEQLYYGSWWRTPSSTQVRTRC